MVRPLSAASAAERLAAARALIASLLDLDDVGDDEPLGDIRLQPRQHEAVRRVRRLVARHGGAMLADAVGVGKTFAALAVARRYAQVVVIAPAALRGMWEAALQRTGVAARFVSYERLSRGGEPHASPDFVILDEAHHLRNRSALRYAAAAALCRRAPSLLLSATPLQNRLGELATLLALFLGTRADSLASHELARYVVRTVGDAADAGLPRLDGPHALHLPEDDDCLALLLALPPPLPAADEGSGGALLLYSLVQQWASSRAALTAALRRRLARAVAFGAALESGHVPSRRELAAWSLGDDAIQLAFPELVVAPRSAPAELLASVRAHEAALRETLRRLGNGDSIDAARADALRRIRAAHPGERIIAFSQFGETVHALGRALLADGGAAWLTARGGRIATGTISRRALLAQLTPGAPSPPRVERVDLLVTTDVLSEGLNLQEASVIVHLDLPWNPARLEQRVGRVRRLGARYEVVTVYAMSPPAHAERLLRLDERLREKLRVARQTIGGAAAVLPSELARRAELEAGEAEEAARIRSIVGGWRSTAPPSVSTPARATLVAAVAATRSGFLGCLRSDGSDEAELVAALDGHPNTRAAVVRRAAEAVDGGPAVLPDASLLAHTTTALRSWWTARTAADAVDVGAAAAARTIGDALARVERICACAPRHRRAVITELAADARAALVASRPRGAERELAAIAASQLDDDAWLRALGAFAPRVTSARVELATDAAPPIRALILLQHLSAISAND